MREQEPPPELSTDPARRRWLIGGLAGAAALAGSSLAWHNYKMSSTAESELWQLSFAKLDGSRLGMASFRGKPALLNFWATWCPPCIEELPLLSSFYHENVSKGWQVLGLAVDQSTPVEQFLARNPVTFPVVLAGMSGIELSRSLGNLAGGLPFTVVFGSDGGVVQRKIGKLTVDDLRALAMMP
jgi:thiol-disulfide isomerase/thioredoxin